MSISARSLRYVDVFPCVRSPCCSFIIFCYLPSCFPFSVSNSHDIYLATCLICFLGVLFSNRYPSYGFFVRNDVINATSMMEHWDTPMENSSHNHAWMNSVALFYRKYFAGLAPSAPGWSEVRVRPWPLGKGCVFSLLSYFF